MGPMSRRLLGPVAWPATWPVTWPAILLAFLASATACGSAKRAASPESGPPPVCATSADHVRLESQTMYAASESGTEDVAGKAELDEDEEAMAEAEAEESVAEAEISAARAAAPSAAPPVSGNFGPSDLSKRRAAPAQCVVTEETYAADFSRDLQTLDVQLGQRSTHDTADCEDVCDLAGRICSLKDKICNLTGLNPAPSIAERCADAEGRCAKATAQANEQCSCEPG
jgi:hypothetical protein